MYILTSKYFPTDSWPDLYFPALPEGADIQYTEVMEFAVCIAASADFDVVLPNDVETVPGTVTVSGAGTSEANGTYTYEGEEYGKPYYSLGSQIIVWIDFAGYKLWNLNGWYQSTDDVATPDLVTTWNVVNDGIAPVPTVTSTNAISGISVTVPFTLEMPQVIEIEVYEELSA